MGYLRKESTPLSLLNEGGAFIVPVASLSIDTVFIKKRQGTLPLNPHPHDAHSKSMPNFTVIELLTLKDQYKVKREA